LVVGATLSELDRLDALDEQEIAVSSIGPGSTIVEPNLDDVPALTFEDAIAGFER
jgi:hypothetical protein